MMYYCHWCGHGFEPTDEMLQSWLDKDGNPNSQAIQACPDCIAAQAIALADDSNDHAKLRALYRVRFFQQRLPALTLVAVGSFLFLQPAG